ncbi:MAG: hypothetical protein QM817_14110 [Archangium sp.]
MMRALMLALLLGASSDVDSAQVASLQVNDLEKRVLLKLLDGKEVEAPREPGQIWQMDPAMSSDRKWVGWLVAFEGQANNATPKGVAFLRGRELRTLKVERMIWRWGFYKDSLVVALGPERPHEPAEYVWYSLPKLELRASIKRFELNEYDPEWAHAAKLRSRLE